LGAGRGACRPALLPEIHNDFITAGPSEPWQVLDYVRQRELLPNGDYDRRRHQQQFLMAVLKQTASAGTLTDRSSSTGCCTPSASP
jgi:hypothetical protein